MSGVALGKKPGYCPSCKERNGERDRERERERDSGGGGQHVLDVKEWTACHREGCAN